MKKILGILALFVLVVPMALAGDEVITPQVAGMQPTDIVTIEVCVTDKNDNPFQGVNLSVTCEGANTNLNEACDVAENGNTAEFDATILNDGLTDADGCEDVQLQTINATFQEYVYRIQADEIGNVTGKVAEETAFAVIPEFTTIGAALVLLGAGAFAIKKRRH